jgi:outer membrane lipoprotein-sorting protein
MKMLRTVTAGAAVAMMLGGNGCFRSTKLVRKTQAPDMYKSAPVEVLEQEICSRDKSIQSLRANVLVTARTGGGRTGKETTYTSLKGYLFLRKPNDLRVILQVPIEGSRALDMVSSGGRFTMVNATFGHGDQWRTGSNVVTSPSKNGLENLRPPVFFDSLMVPCVAKDEFVAVNESTRILPSPDKKRTDIEEPDYDLAILKRKMPGKFLQTGRVIHISRVNLLPYEQDIYDDQGRVVTRAMYERYQKTGDVDFPMTITIDRPLEQYSLKIEITKLALNDTFENDQFVLKVPDGVKVQEMK